MKNTIRLMNYEIYTGNLLQIDTSKKMVITTINQYSFCLAEENEELKNALLQSDLLLPEGLSIVFAIRILLGKKIKKITAVDIHLHLLRELNENGGSCFYLGSSSETLLRITERLGVEFPNIRVGGCSTSSNHPFLKLENKQIIDTVNTFEPDVLFLGMNSPQQENWACHHKFQLKTKAICAIGSVFEFYADTNVTQSSSLIRLKLEFLSEFVKKSKRIRKRYLYYLPVFIGYMLQNKKRLVLK